MEEDKECNVCSEFEPQAWRMSLCRNCFHTLDDHSEEILGAEAKAAAREKAAAAASAQLDSRAATLPRAKDKKGSVSDTADSKSSKGDGKLGKEMTTSKSNESLSSGEKDSKLKSVKSKFDKDSKPSWASKDLGREYGTPRKKSIETDDSKATNSTSSSTSSKLQSSKSSPKSSTTSSTNFSTTTTSSAQSKTAEVSKAKAVASKFENKQSPNTSKPPSKPSDLRTSANSVSSITGKLSKTNGLDSKANEKEQTTADSKELQSSTGVGKPNNSSKTDSVDGKDKKGLLSTSASRSKSAPFGKDMLKSTKDSKSSTVNDKQHSQDSQSKPSSFKTPGIDSKSKLVGHKLDEKTGNKNSDKTSTSKPSLDADKTVSASGPSAGSKNETKSSVVSSPTSSGAAIGKDAKSDGAKVNTSGGQLAKYLPGKYGERAGDVTTKETSKAEHTNKTAGEAGGTIKGKTVERDKGASPREKQGGEEAGGKGTENAGKIGGANEKLVQSPVGKQSSVGKQETSGARSVNDSSSSSVLEKKDNLSNDKTDVKKPKDLRLTSNNNALSKFKELDQKAASNDFGITSPVKSPSTTVALPNKDGGKESPKAKATAEDSKAVEEANKLSEELKHKLEEKEKKLERLAEQLSKMEAEKKKVEEEKEKAVKEVSKTKLSQKEDMEKMLKEMREHLQTTEVQCGKLQKDNEELLKKLQTQEQSVKKNQAEQGMNETNLQLEEDLEAAEQELEEQKEENKTLQAQIMEMKNEMDEMHDHFRENEHDEFRELQRELEITAKNCRILQFKFRKSERRNEQIEEDRLHYEEKLRKLQDQFDSQDAKSHIQLLDEELRVAKEVSVRLHDELDIVEDKKNKALEENRHLTELLEHTDKRQFRLEMEIDKLRDMVQDLKLQLREAKAENGDDPNDRKVQSYIYTRSISD